MPQFSRTWWGQRFIEALEQFTDAGRLGRGRSYASNGRILSYQIEKGAVRAKVRGSINPYFGVYKEPTYSTTVKMAPIASADWTRVIADLSSKAGFIAKLLLNEIPNNVEDVFSRYGVHLLPHGPADFTTSCSCPDYANPCKHVAGLCYVVAAALDQDPFLAFELRGLARDQLRTELARSPLGQILVAELTERELPIVPATSYYTRPTRQAPNPAVSYKEFWTGPRRLPPLVDANSAPTVPALLIKKQGDYPPFWPKDASFIDVMEQIYERIRTKSNQLK
jgi:uncharacterized Zn finger protein